MTIHSIISIDAPVVVVPDKNLFSSFTNVHGVIGYELFLNLEIEINHSKKQITFRPPKHTTHSLEFTMLPLRLVDSKPMLECNFVFLDGINHGCELMIDTGSNLNLLLKTTNPSFLANEGIEKILGRGFNGNVEGVEVLTRRLLLNGMEIKSVPTGIMVSSHFNYASIGMGVLKDYIVVINYCRGFVGMRINEATP